MTSGNAKVCLWKSDSKKIAIKDNALVSGEFVRQGCDLSKEKAWDELQEAGKLMQLIITGRDYFRFDVTGIAKRWGCRNLYGATYCCKIRGFYLEGKGSWRGESVI